MVHFLLILGNSSVYGDNYLPILGHSFVRGVSENFVSFSRGGWLLGGFVFFRGVSDPPGKYELNYLLSHDDGNLFS